MDNIIHLQGDPNSRLTPLFLVHPISGCMLPYVGLEPLSDFDDDEERPVYGINSYFLTDRAKQQANPQDRPRSLEHTAEVYIRWIQDSGLKRSEQPWLLGGWSLGGMIAYRMCTLLAVAKNQVVLDCIMIDSPCPRQFPSFESEQELLLVLSLALKSVQTRSKAFDFDAAGFASILAKTGLPRPSPLPTEAPNRARPRADEEWNGTTARRLAPDGVEWVDGDGHLSDSGSSSSSGSSDRSRCPSSATTSPSLSSPSGGMKEGYFASEDEYECKSKADQLRLSICESIHTFLVLLSRESSFGGSEPSWELLKPYRGRVTLIKCSSLASPNPALSERRKGFAATFFSDPTMGWRAMGIGANLRCLRYPVPVAHDECFDSKIVPLTSELLRAALVSVRG
ncbi:hypothetical protein IE53DRAFT_90968 [Violaceomyces palustris]|uniref:Uncharacterized protein n=1 Tax=Violaceomyces palustris TaxID=1673888 RepID=A0ACD0NXG8_9BASI|nr:hypothetical protein IE53DRAFT_90968 [Violaceomyces palustris]